MTLGRAVASVTASLTVAGCAVVALGMSSGNSSHGAGSGAARLASAATPTARPAFMPRTATSSPAHSTRTSARAAAVASRSAAASPVSSPTGTPSTAAVSTPPPVATSTSRATHALTRATASRTATVQAPSTHPATRPAIHTAIHTAPTHPAVRTRPSTTRPSTTHPTATDPTATHASKGRALPLGFSTGNARKVITVVAHSHSSTTATLQAWSKVSGGWVRHGSAATANVGSDGLSTHPSESRSATPIGSFSLTRAFGHDSNPGTALPYVHTTPADWWISQPGKLYNTLQVCSSHCSFNQGNPNEHLYYETPYYDYAVVIDYNTRNAPGGVHQGNGSAFFLHVSVGAPTAGCVSIPKPKLVSILRWLTPQAHARILIGVT